MSYVRERDLFGAVSEFREGLQNEIRMRLPPAYVFQDTIGIKPGEYKGILENEIERADTFVVLTSPAWFASQCVFGNTESFVRKRRRQPEHHAY